MKTKDKISDGSEVSVGEISKIIITNWDSHKIKTITTYDEQTEEVNISIRLK